MDFTHTQRIERPAGEVFAFVADFENNPTWQGGMVRCTWDGPERGVGSTYSQEARFFGRPILTTFRVTALDPGRSISIESIQSTFPIQVTRTVALKDGGCTVTAHVRGQPTGLLKLFSAMVPRSIRKDYAALQAQLESSAS
jgi:hypothetical protein